MELEARMNHDILVFDTKHYYLIDFDQMGDVSTYESIY